LPRSVIKQYHRLLFSKEISVNNISKTDEVDNESNNQQTEESDNSPIFSEYVEGLTTISSEKYKSDGGRIIDFSLSDEKSKKINMITSGAIGIVKMVVEFDDPFQNVVFGFHLKSISGLEVAGMTFPNSISDGIAVNEGDKFEVSWKINVLLNEGMYFFTTGVRSAGKEEKFIDRIVDVYVIKVIKNLNSLSYGIFDISAGEVFLNGVKINEKN
jgi:lipopolysaccharide transport system ATP-binding protein